MKICLGDGVAPDLECFQGSFGHNVDDGSQAQRFLDGGIRIWHDGQCILAHLGATLTDHLQQSFVKSTICIADNYNRPDIFVRAGAGGEGGGGGGEAGAQSCRGRDTLCEAQHGEGHFPRFATWGKLGARQQKEVNRQELECSSSNVDFGLLSSNAVRRPAGVC